MGDLDDAGVDRRLALGLVQLVDRARVQLGGEGNRLVALVTEHLGQAVEETPNITTLFPGWEHINVHHALRAYLAEHSPDAEWFGVTGQHAAMQDVIDVLVSAARTGAYELGAPSYATVADGPTSAVDAVQLGLVRTYAPGGEPVVIGLRGPTEHMPQPMGQIRVLARTAETASVVRTVIEDLMTTHDVYSGQVLQFDVSERRGNELVSFLPRPELVRDEVILPDGVLAEIEEHVVRSAAVSDRLREAGQHLKRGVLLYGPPGTGKTHTVRYLMSRLVGRTVVVLSGRALTRLLPAAVSLARRAQPSVVVVEDVDLIAEDRSMGPAGNPLLFELLNRIDGIDGDADVTFLLTTNRVEVLERALSQRPGRVDLAVDIPRPDADSRRRLFRLYARDALGDLPVDSPLVSRTSGVTASFVRELVRRGVLAALTRGDDPVELTEAFLLEQLDALDTQTQALTRSILGAGETSDNVTT